jgi:hypothetical protein
MRRSLALVALVFIGCGPDVTAWKGTYSGSGSLNAGRQPEAVVGTLTITDDARFTLTTTPMGTSNQVWTCALVAQSVDATKARFQVPTTCPLSVTPSDNCTHQVTINAAQVTRTGTAVEGTVSGRINSRCTSGNAINDFLLSFAGMKG